MVGRSDFHGRHSVLSHRSLRTQTTSTTSHIMGKRKREEEERITKKIKKLERKLQRRRRVISSDDDDSDIELQVLPSLTPSSSPAATPRASPINHGEAGLDMPSLISPIPRTPSRDLEPKESTVKVDLPLAVPGPSTAPDIGSTNVSNQEEETELDDDILQILGEAPQPDLALGKSIHKDIASRWQDILLKGLPKEVKESISKKYLIPANCHFLVAPLLNPEAKAAVPEVLAKRDTTIMQKQNQIGVALAALSQVSEMILRNETSKQALLQPLSDACRILCDSHNVETKTRRSILMSSINTSLRDTLSNANRDKYLFGEDLAEKLKVAKTVQKTGESLLKTNPVASSSKTMNSKSNPKRNLNFRGPTQRRPPNRTSESSRGRPPGRQTRAPTYSRPPPPPPKAPSPNTRNYRR
ncbi:uncharacterized protein LOC114361403 [Ostrinia furnacalis]|uniref:uncharacterized protein LOC114361403 n=1 Tax=Ostrinia furnacalis TaxID=93504 RepID=UPI00103BBA89|nr:uncharacterized protein LOC114361403 [Ostrinia furnacalis]